MAIEISPNVIAAFEQAADSQEVDEFVSWWTQFALTIGPPPPFTIATNILDQARSDARELGIEDNENSRVFLQAVATRLMPEMSGTQFLLATDVLFLDANDSDRIDALVDINRRQD